MALSTVMQTVTVSPVTRVSYRTSGLNQAVPASGFVPRLTKRSAALRVRATAEDSQKEEAEPVAVPPPPSPKPTPPRAPKVSTKFTDVLAFSGPAPEVINGRLAMIGFVAALGAEIASGQDVFQQLANGGIPAFLVTSIVLSAASLVPLFKGVSVASKSDGIMTSDAELWNGRFAMLGLVALAFTEYVKGGALV
ncbi:hypothetical protein RJ639_001335 [Escallonia herrerae]|uniref:Early light-induced protein n=1 Tax=Escallonia herrerae TaxID=1293975 RepID=A0AA88XPR5_9ASTE|nr:hypothetical protein RJ639_001335 [Escallonia herrerae]